MAITLDPTLAEAQDSMVRQPIVKLLATQVVDSMPFDGSYFNTIADTEKYTDLITSEDEHLVGAYTNGRYIVLVSTDLGRTLWNTTSTYFWSGRSLLGIGISEIEVGSIGTLFIDGSRIVTSIIDENTGAFSSGPSVVEDFSTPEYVTCLAVRKLQDETYFSAYIVLNTTADTYEIRTRTSSDFITWGVASVVPLTGLVAGMPVDNVSILQVSSGEILLFFDYVTKALEGETAVVTNVFSISSLDNGATWGTPEQLTDYVDYGTSALDPHATEKLDGTIALAYTDAKKVLFANSSTLLWDNQDCGAWSNTNATNIHFDPNRRRVYIYQIRTYVGIKAMCGVIVMDVDTWKVVNVYNAHTNPGYSTYFQNVHLSAGRDQGNGEFAVFSSGIIAVCINDLEETVNQYVLRNLDSYELLGNVDYTPFVFWWQKGPIDSIRSTYMDIETRRLFILLFSGSPFGNNYDLGYIDVDELPDASTGKYKFNSISSGDNTLSGICDGGMRIIHDRNIMIIEEQTQLAGYTQYPGYITLIDLNSGGIVKRYSRATHNLFPLGGMKYTVYSNGCIYGSFPYTTVDDQTERRGLCKINIDTDEITYHEPTYTTANDYGLKQKEATEDGRILIALSGGGVAVFDPVNGGWTLHNNSTIPGFETGSSSSNCSDVAYDELEKNILVGSISTITTGAFTGLRMFNEIGAYNIGRLLPATPQGEDWDWGDSEQLTVDHTATDMAVTVDADNVLWSIWTDTSGSEVSTKWDKDVKEMQIEDYLVAGKDITVTWSLEKTATLSFTVSHGHLFDRNNTLSTWNNFIRKGKIIELSFGDKIDGVDYWQKQGTFNVDVVKLVYRRGTYPEMQVTCVCPDVIWDNIIVPATQRYDSTNPEELIRDVIIKHALLEPQNVIVGTFPNRHDIHHQWVDTDLKSLVTEYLSHFQSVPQFDADGNFVTKIVKADGEIVHTYTGAEIIEFTPDDKYSSFTTKVIVKGEGLFFIEVTYPEELIETITGTCGWWEDGNRDITVDYSSDRSVVCYDPRLVIKTSIQSFPIFNDKFPQGKEEITYIDPLNRYCIVTVELPGLMLILMGFLAATLALAYAAGTCTYNCGVFIMLITIAQCAISWIIGQICSYEYEVYAKPTGKEKQMLSYSVEDLEFKREMGGIDVTDEYDDPFCYTVQSCKEVAEYEMDIIKAQRKRISFKKLAHLQDEIMDKIRINHPYSKQSLDIIITELTRTYNRTERSNQGGYFNDSIVGWVT